MVDACNIDTTHDITEIVENGSKHVEHRVDYVNDVGWGEPDILKVP